VIGSSVGPDGTTEAMEGVRVAVVDRGAGSADRVGVAKVAEIDSVGEVTEVGKADGVEMGVGAGTEKNVSDRGLLVRFNAVRATADASTPASTAAPISGPMRQPAARAAAASSAGLPRCRPDGEPSLSASTPAGSAVSGSWTLGASAPAGNWALSTVPVSRTYGLTSREPAVSSPMGRSRVHRGHVAPLIGSLQVRQDSAGCMFSFT
jgi:hypothetical protein